MTSDGGTYTRRRFKNHLHDVVVTARQEQVTTKNSLARLQLMLCVFHYFQRRHLYIERVTADLTRVFCSFRYIILAASRKELQKQQKDNEKNVNTGFQAIDISSIGLIVSSLCLHPAFSNVIIELFCVCSLLMSQLSMQYKMMVIFHVYSFHRSPSPFRC